MQYAVDYQFNAKPLLPMLWYTIKPHHFYSDQWVTNDGVLQIDSGRGRAK